METSAFKDWFNRKYEEWIQAQPGEEDFLAFCDLLGYAPVKVNEWLDGVSVPEGPESLGIAGIFGIELFAKLGQLEPDENLLTIFDSFPHLSGELRSRLAQAIWEIETLMRDRNITVNSREGKQMITRIFKIWGFEYTKGERGNSAQ